MSGPILLALRIGLTVSLYAFLGWALLTLWQNVQQESALLAARKVPAIDLISQDAQAEPVVRHFAQPEITLGRDLHCEVPLDDETVSARHARLTYHHGQWWLEDLGSTNGTTLNQERVSTPTVVITGDQIGCGKATLTVRLASDSLSPPTQRV
ncbi:MAG: FHA domain-containing protein [Chloroflexi bacterium]|nr:FHA domain-containing protein [Chloroflexota bacterium]